MKSMMCIVSIICLISMVSVGETSETVKVAAVFGITGDGATMIFPLLKGARFAVEEVNAQGGLLGKRVKLIEFDNKGSALGSKLAAQQAVKAGVVAVIRASFSSNSLAMAPVLQEANIPMISPNSTNPQVTKVGDYIFRVCFIDSFQGASMADFAIQDLKANTAVVLTNTGDKYSMGLAEVFIKQFQAQGNRILWEGDYQSEATNFSSQLEQVKRVNPDVVFVPEYYRDSGYIIKQARNMGITVPFLGGDGWGEGMYDYGGTAIQGNYFSSHWHQDSPHPRSREFVKNYIDKYGEIENVGVPLAYDAVMLMADAIRRANSLEPRRIRDALAATTNFQGVTGVISFDENRNPVKSVVILKFDKEKPVFVKMIEPR